MFSEFFCVVGQVRGNPEKSDPGSEGGGAAVARCQSGARCCCRLLAWLVWGSSQDSSRLPLSFPFPSTPSDSLNPVVGSVGEGCLLPCMSHTASRVEVMRETRVPVGSHKFHFVLTASSLFLLSPTSHSQFLLCYLPFL